MNYTNSDSMEISIELKYALNAAEKSSNFLNYLRNKSIDISRLINLIAVLQTLHIIDLIKLY